MSMPSTCLHFICKKISKYAIGVLPQFTSMPMLMLMLMVRIRHMRMHMVLRCMLVPVAVRAGGHVGVRVLVMTVVV